MNATIGTRRGLRRVLGLSLGSAMIMAMVPGVASAQEQPDAIDTSVICGDVQSNFSDIAGSAHEYNVRCMADFGLTEGLRGGDEYGPRLDVTRGQMASFIARFIEDYNEAPLPPGNPARFDDVPPTDAQYVHATNIHSLAAIGVVEGTSASDGQSYAPNADVNRAQMASFIRRALSYIDNGSVSPLSAPPDGPDSFPDDDGSIHEPNINAIAGVRIVEGFEDGDYGPLLSVKRDQMASFVMRAYAWADSENLGEDDDTTAPGLDSTTPADDATDVPVGTSVSASYDEDLAGDSSIELVCDDAAVDGAATIAGDTITFDPDADLGFEDACEATITARDAAGNETVTVITFTTEAEDVTAPTIDTAEVDEVEDTITVTYDEAVDCDPAAEAATAAQFTYNDTDDTDANPTNVACDGDATVVLTFAADVLVESDLGTLTYTDDDDAAADANDIMDLAGNQAASPDAIVVSAPV